MRAHPLVIVAVIGALGACASDGAPDGSSSASSAVTTDAGDGTSNRPATGSAVQQHPDVIAATATSTEDGWTITATLSSPYDSPERYADAWRVLDPDGAVLGVRHLVHDHADEQPFTRSLEGVEIPEAVAEVTIEGHDLRYGWGGATVTVELARDP